MVLVDDLGWGDVNFNRINPITGGSAPADPEIITPTMDQLAADGIHLTRHYVYRFVLARATAKLCGCTYTKANPGCASWSSAFHFAGTAHPPDRP